jgi:hypothetical protein
VPSIRGTLSVRLVVERIIVVVVPFIMALLLDVLMLLAPVINPTMCISDVDDIMQISVFLIMPSAALL